jgi:transposase
MISKEKSVDIWSLARQGYSKREIARKLGLNFRTVAKYLKTGELPQYKKVSRHSKLEPYYGMIQDWLAQEDYQATRIYELLIQQRYEGSYETVKRYVRGIKEERDRVAYIRFETVPGLQAQVDFADFKVIEADGKETTLYSFIMILGYSRHMYVELVDHCTMTSFLDCHKNAFGYFGGISSEILYDNIKNVVIKRLLGSVKFNATFYDFAMHYRFKPIVSPPYAAWYKGKVERPVHYIRERFWRGYSYVNLKRTNQDVLHWLKTVASARIHGTTHQRVSERFEQEKGHLGQLPLRPYDTSEKVIRKVYKDCQVCFGSNQYVVPHKYVGKKVLLKVKEGILKVYHDDELLTVYRIPEGKGKLVAHPWFYAALKADKEQIRRKYHHSPGKGKATRGLLKHGVRFEMVQRRDLTEYENLVGEERCLR